MTRSTLRRASAAAVAVLALASLAACGGDDDGDGDETSAESSESASDDASDDPDASETTDDAEESEDPEESEATDDPGATDDPEAEEEVGDEIEPDEFIDTYREAMDNATTTKLKLSFEGTAGVMGRGAADFTTTPPSMSLVISDPGTGQDQKMVIVDGKAYLGLAPKQYIEYDLSDPNSPLGSLTDQLDPRAMIETFEEGLTRTAYVGEEDVAGEQMDHYAVTVDGKALLGDAEIPGASSSAAGEQVTIDLWFDQDGMIRRQAMNLGAAGGTVELSYDSWGEPVDITAPPESQITRLPNG